MKKSILLKLLNKEIQPYNTSNNYFATLGESLSGICRVLDSYLLPNDLMLGNIDKAAGRYVFEIETLDYTLYLTYSWYRMQNGKYEIVAYFS